MRRFCCVQGSRSVAAAGYACILLFQGATRCCVAKPTERLLLAARLLQTAVKPCALHGGPYPSLLQQVIQKKHDDCERELQMAYQFLLHLGVLTETTAGDGKPPVRQLDTDLHRERKMAKALRTITLFRASVYTRRCSSATSAFHLERPAGCVEVPSVVGYVYVELQERGYDAETWWRGYYRRFVQPSVTTRPFQRAEGGTKATTATVTKEENLLQGASYSTVPPLYWARQKYWGRHADKDGGKDTVTYATPVPLYKNTHPSCLTSAAAQVSSPYWIPLSLLLHLPFFPVPHPEVNLSSALSDSYVMDDVEQDNAEDDAEFDYTNFTDQLNHSASQNTRASAQSVEASENEAPVSFGTHADENWSPWNANKCSCPSAGEDGQQHVAHSPSPRSNRGWLHPFYDELFTSKKKDQYQSNQNKSALPWQNALSASGVADAAHAWLLEKRARCPLDAPWCVEPLLATDVRSDLSGAPLNGDTKPDAGSEKRPFSSSSPGATVRPSSATSSWPNPVTVLQLDPGYQPNLTHFWARKVRVLQNLVRPYFFSFTVYPFLLSQLNKTEREAQGKWNTARNDRFDGRTTWMTSQLPFKLTPKKLRGSNSETPEQQGTHQSVYAAFSGSLPFSQTNHCRRESNKSCINNGFKMLNGYWQLRAVTYFGQKYIPVTCTALACLLDSSTCVQHAVPLNVYGGVLTVAITPTRHRQQRRVSCTMGLSQAVTHPRGSLPIVATRTTQPPVAQSGKPSRSTDVEITLSTGAQHVRRQKKHDSAAHPRSLKPSRSPWLARLHKVQTTSHWPPRPITGVNNENIVGMRDAQRNNYFLFRSPYWVEMANLYERWGVHVAPGVVPLRTGQSVLVNAKQTTDASCFTPATCVPHLQQEILFCGTLFRCPWSESQQLLNVIAPDVRSTLQNRKSVCAWTYQTLKARAEAVQRVSNLWIADEVIQKLGWTLRPVPIASITSAEVAGKHTAATNGRDPGVETILHAELPLECFRLTRLRRPAEAVAATTQLANNASHLPSALTPNPALQLFEHPSEQVPRASQQQLWRQLHKRPSVTVFHSSCVAEQVQLAFVATYAPEVLFVRIPDVTHEDFYCNPKDDPLPVKPWDLNTVRERADAVLRKASTAAEDADDNGASSPSHNEHTCFELEMKKYDVAFRLAWEMGDTNVVRYLKAATAKRSCFAVPWRGIELTMASRVELAALALRKGYRAENALRWVALDFLRNERRVRPVQRPLQRCGVAAPSSSSSCNEITSPTSDVPARGNTVGNDAGLTAIEVEAHTGYQQNDKALMINDPAALPLAELPIDAADEKRLSTEVYAHIKFTLVNWEELEWPSTLSHVDRFMWLFKEV